MSTVVHIPAKPVLELDDYILCVRARRRDIASTEEDKGEKYLHNPAYEDTYMHISAPIGYQVSPEKQPMETSFESTYEVVEDALSKRELEHENSYDVLNRECLNGRY